MRPISKRRRRKKRINRSLMCFVPAIHSTVSCYFVAYFRNRHKKKWTAQKQSHFSLKDLTYGRIRAKSMRINNNYSEIPLSLRKIYWILNSNRWKNGKILIMSIYYYYACLVAAVLIVMFWFNVKSMNKIGQSVRCLILNLKQS